MLPTSWEIASLVCKILFYFGAASVVGGSLFLRIYNDGSRSTVQSNIRYITLGAFIGFQGVLFNFLVQIGLVVDSGFFGMFDWSMSSIFLNTQLGDTTFFRMAGFVIIFLACLFCSQSIRNLNRPPKQEFYKLLNIINLFAFLLIVFSFRFSGHISVLSPIAKIAIALHFFSFAAWIGSLYPLYKLTFGKDLDFMYRSMRKFGNNAMGIVLVLVGAGVLMCFELFGSLSELFTTSYGQALLVKLVFVLAITFIAAFNKLRLTPCLYDEGGALALRNSIHAESVVALFILIVTSYLSTIVGPADYSM